MFIGLCGASLRAGLPGSKRPRCGAAAQSARNAGLLRHGVPVASSLSRRLVCRHGHRRFAGGTNFAGCQFGLCSIRRERQPNNSLKRTVQSLRDWSCRLAPALGVAGGACQGSCRLNHAAICRVCSALAAVVLTTESRSGLRLTTPMCDQSRVLPDQRLGLHCRAWMYSACRAARIA